MKVIYALPILFFVVSCNEQDTTEALQDKPVAQIPSAKREEVESIPDDPSFVNQQDTISEYGPTNITRNILEDKSGNIWFATWQGIIKYDGKLFTNYTLKEGLGLFHVQSLLEDRSGNIWFGTIGGGVYCYNGSSFTHFTTENGLVANTVMCMIEDNAGNIWFGTNFRSNRIVKMEGGISCFDGKSFKNFTTINGLPHNSVFSMVKDNAGKLWFGTEGGLCYYDVSQNKFIKPEGLSFRHVLAMQKDKKGNIWIGDQYGLTRYDPISKDTSIVSSNGATNIFEDKEGNLWLSSGERNATKMCLILYDKKSFTKIRSEKQIFGVIEDKIGNIWFGTEKGIYCYDGRIFNDFR